MKLSDDAKHLLACLAYEVRYLRKLVERDRGEAPLPRYIEHDLDGILEWLGYPAHGAALEPVGPGWDPPELEDEEEETPAWTVQFERKYLGEAEPRTDMLESYPVVRHDQLISHIQLKFPISVVEWIRLTPQRPPLDKADIVEQARRLLDQLEESEDATELPD